MKLTSDSWYFMLNEKSVQLSYGARENSPVASSNCRRTELSGGIPSLRPRAMLNTAKSIGRPRSWLRNTLVMNSSMWLP